VLKIKRGNIAVCKAAILNKFQKRYPALYDSGRGQIDSKKHSSKCIYGSVALQQESAVGNLLKKRGVMVSGSALSPLSESPFHLHWQGRALQPLSEEASRIHLPSLPREQCQLLSRQDLHSLYACAALFKRIFFVPHRKQIGGELLDLNYANVYKQNKAHLLKFAKVFALAFLGNGAAIHQMAPINILAMSSTFPCMTISI
jgi:hypothetical protein